MKIEDGKRVYDIDNDAINMSNMSDKKDPNGIYLDFDTEGIPDLNNLTSEIVNFLEYVGSDEMVKLENLDPKNFELHLESKFENFTLKYMNVYKMLLNKNERECNLAKLLKLIDILKDVKNGNKNMEQEFGKFKESLAEEYVYPKFGGKDKFEKKIIKRAQKKQTNNNNNK